MFCKKCSGRVFVDRVYSQNLRIEFFCVLCGKRWMIRRDNEFASWVAEKEKLVQHAYGISI
jgi:hypothetical protein